MTSLLSYLKQTAFLFLNLHCWSCSFFYKLLTKDAKENAISIELYCRLIVKKFPLQSHLSSSRIELFFWQEIATYVYEKYSSSAAIRLPPFVCVGLGSLILYYVRTIFWQASTRARNFFCDAGNDVPKFYFYWLFLFCAAIFKILHLKSTRVSRAD